ncbi:MAG: ATP-grasp domain-containing protein [Odoribacter sp.]|nr:ATP-grasp domain-containing protein [Odoribacter sp.]
MLKAKDMGLEVHCFSWKDGAVCSEYADFFYPLSITEKEEILATCEKIGIDGVISIASDLAVLTVNYIADALNLIANPDDYSSLTTNKYIMREYFQKFAIPSPFYFLSKNKDSIDFEKCNYPLIVKPTDRSGSLGVCKVNSYDKLESAIERACKESFSGEAIVEEFVSGREVSVEAISYNGEHHILSLTDKVTTGEPYFVELEHHQPAVLDSSLKEKISSIVIRALNALNIKYGASHSELKITDKNEIFVIEVGARMGGDFIGSDLVYLSTGYDFLEAIINVALGKFTEPKISNAMHAGGYFLSKETEYLKKTIDNYSFHPEIIKAEITSPILKCVEKSGDRSGYFIYQANSKFVPL